jgi:hypothetical protein
MPRKTSSSKTTDSEKEPKPRRNAKASPEKEEKTAPKPEPATRKTAAKASSKKAIEPETQPEAADGPQTAAEAKPKRAPRKKKEAEPQAKAKPPAKRPRAKRDAAPSEEPVQADVAAEEKPKRAARAKAAKPARTKRGKAKDESYDAESDLPVPIWRAVERQGEATAPAASANGKVGERKSRRRRRKDLEDTEITAAAALESKPRGKRQETEAEAAIALAEPLPPVVEPPKEPPPKPMIPIPDDAPQVIVKDGVSMLVRNKRVYPPISFFGSASDERRAGTVLEEIRLAAARGIHLHTHLVELEVDHDSVDSAVSFAGYLLKKTLEVDPDAQVLFRLVFVAPAGWSESYPNATFSEESGRLADPSLCDDDYWGVARDCLQTFVKSLRLLEERDHILGLHLERGEWFFADGAGYDTSKAALHKFREWARARYLNDIVALRAAWFDGDLEFDQLTIPEYRNPAEGGETFVRSSRKERRWVDYHLFLSDSTVARISELAYSAKEASEGYFLLGVSYGYTFEWSHPSSGHLSLGKLLRNPEIDFIAGPPSYRNREAGGAASFPSPIDSYPINGKLYISEEDYKTAIGDWKEPDDFNPVIRTPQALESVHWRGAGAALAHASGVCWMDLWGNGWLKTSTIWDRGAKVKDCLMLRLGTPLTDPDIAVFIDERALAYLADQHSFAVLVQNVRESVLRAGVSAGFYLLSDLTHRESFPESRLYVFLNAWDLRPDLRAAIKNRCQRDGKVLFWLYGAGMFDSGRESLERAREVTGVALKPQPFQSTTGTTILNRRHPLCDAFPERGIIGGSRLGTSYFAIPEDALVLGEYSQTGLPSFVVKEFATGDPQLHWKSVFMGEPVVTPALVRALSLMAGAHVWNYQDDVVHVRPPFLTVHCSGTGPRAITLPDKWAAYNLVSQDWVATEASSLRFHALDGSTHLFLVGRHADIEALLQKDPDDLLHLDEIPSRAENTVRLDAYSFDVPIMKLGEWMEGGTLDDVSEDWLLHPKVSDLEEEEAAPEEEVERTVGRRRRRRGGRRDGDRPSGGERAAPKGNGGEDDLGMHVVFRKRD